MELENRLSDQIADNRRQLKSVHTKLDHMETLLRALVTGRPHTPRRRTSRLPATLNIPRNIAPMNAVEEGDDADNGEGALWQGYTFHTGQSASWLDAGEGASWREFTFHTGKSASWLDANLGKLPQ